MTATPRTDAEPPVYAGFPSTVSREFARALERELAAAQAEIAALREDAKRLDWFERIKHGVTINPPGEHGGELSNWLVTVEGESGWAESEDEGPTLRAAIDLARKG